MDAELREKILTLGVCTGPYDSPHRCSSMHCNHCGLCDVSEDLMALIASYSRAEMLQKFKWLNHFDDSELREVITSELKTLKKAKPEGKPNE